MKTVQSREVSPLIRINRRLIKRIVWAGKRKTRQMKEAGKETKASADQRAKHSARRGGRWKSAQIKQSQSSEKEACLQFETRKKKDLEKRPKRNKRRWKANKKPKLWPNSATMAMEAGKRKMRKKLGQQMVNNDSVGLTDEAIQLPTTVESKQYTQEETCRWKKDTTGSRNEIQNLKKSTICRQSTEKKHTQDKPRRKRRQISDKDLNANRRLPWFLFAFLNRETYPLPPNSVYPSFFSSISQNRVCVSWRTKQNRHYMTLKNIHIFKDAHTQTHTQWWRITV